MNKDRTQQVPDVLNVKEIQAILRIGKRQAYELIKTNQFHTVRVGKSIKIDRESFVRWLHGS